MGAPLKPTLALATVAVVFALLGAVFGFQLSLPAYRFQRLEMHVVADRPAEIEVFYDVGEGFNELDKATAVLEQADTPVLLQFCLSARNILRLRLDPSRSAVRMTIDYLVFYRNEDGYPIALDTLVPVNQIRSHAYNGRALVFETAPDAVDPIFHLTDIGPSAHRTRMETLGFAALGSLAALALLALLTTAGRYFFDLRFYT
jgi:hypothetical protein